MNGELFRLAFQGIRRKKRSSLLLFSVLLLSFAFAIISLSVTSSIRATNKEYRYDTYGTWYGAIPDGRESDETFLRDREWLDELGSTKSYGTIRASTSGSASIGVMDEAFLQIGRIGLQDGRFPESAGEIAMEADLLSALGYDYTVGQEITVTVDLPAKANIQYDGSDKTAAQTVTVSVERTFTLCGVIREYSDLWVRDTVSTFGMPPLNSAMITQEAAEELRRSAETAAAELRDDMNTEIEEECDALWQAALDAAYALRDAVDAAASEGDAPPRSIKDAADLLPDAVKAVTEDENGALEAITDAADALRGAIDAAVEDGTGLHESVKDAADAFTGALKAATGSEREVTKVTPDAVTVQYYFSVLPGSESEMKEQVEEHLNGSDSRLTVNTVAFSEEEAAVEGFYTWLILAVTMLAVVCIYAIRMQDEARQLAIFRSVGITKRQLCVMLLYETVILGVPAMLLGTAAGALGTYLLLRLAVYSGSTAVQVVLPLAALSASAVLWLAGVLAARLAVFLAALRAPLTGRFHVARKRARRYRTLQRILIGVLSSLLCATVIFTVMESLLPLLEVTLWHGYVDYIVTKSGNIGMIRTFNSQSTVSGEKEYMTLDMTFPKTESGLIAQIPGVTRARGAGVGTVRIEFDGIENTPLANDTVEFSKRFYENYSAERAIAYGVGPYDENALTAFLVVVDESEWGDIIDFDIDMEKFRAGEAILMGFRTDSNGMFASTVYSGSRAPRYPDPGLAVGDTVRITVGTPDHYAVTETEVGGFSLLGPDQNDFGFYYLQDQYAVIASEAFLEKLLDSLGPGVAWNAFRQGTPYGHDQVYVFTDRSADYMSTDAVLAQLCTRDGLQIDSRREMNRALEQESLQTLILLWSGGGCTALVLLMILWNTLSMEAERQRRNYGIMQAIGLSRRRILLRQLGTAALRGGLTLISGWILYGVYCVYWSVKEQARIFEMTGTKTAVWAYFQSKVTDLTVNAEIILLLSVSCAAMVPVVSVIAKRRLMREDLMAKLRDEH